MSDNFSYTFDTPPAYVPGVDLNPGNIRFGTPPQPVVAACSTRVALGSENFDKTRSEVVVACFGSKFAYFVAELLSDYKLGLTRTVTAEGRTIGGLLFVGRGKMLFLPFDAHLPTMRKALLDWKRYKSVQCFITTDRGTGSFILDLNNGMLDELLAVKVDKCDKVPTMEMVVAVRAMTEELTQSAQVVTAMMFTRDEPGSKGKRG